MAGTAEGFTARVAARITGLSVARVRRLARHGVVPDRTTHFAFDDLVVLRQVKRLLDAGVPLSRVRQAYTSLGRPGGPGSRPLLSAESGTLLAASGGVRWDAASGQLLLSYARPAGSTGGVVPLRRKNSGPRLTADQWYELGMDLEPTSMASAMEAYASAVRQDPDFVEAHINLGRLLHISGSLAMARKHYERALRIDPLDPIPAFNLGVVQEDLGSGDDEARRYYRLALRRDPDFADAHYNLALVYQRQGSPVKAHEHARRYRELTGSWTGETR